MLNEQEKNILDELKTIFETVNNWLNFAELKHGGCIVYNLAVLAYIQGLIENCKNGFINIGVVFLLLVGLLISLLSYCPVLYQNKIFDTILKYSVCKQRRQDKLNNKESLNLIFYSDIALFSTQEYIETVYSKYFSGQCNYSIVKDYAEEIVINAKITTIKYFLVKLSLLMSTLATCLLIFDLFLL